jgi:hypothetical protein
MIPRLIGALALLLALLSLATGAAAHSGHAKRAPAPAAVEKAPAATGETPAQTTPQQAGRALDRLSAPCPGDGTGGCCCRPSSALPSPGHDALSRSSRLQLALHSFEPHAPPPAAPVFAAQLEAPRPRAPPLQS